MRHMARWMTCVGAALGAAVFGCGDGGGRADASDSDATAITAVATDTGTPPTTGATESAGTSAPTGEGPGTNTDTGGACQVAEDCAEGQFCGQSGVCLGDGACESADDCALDEQCTGGTCQPKPPCAEDGDCGLDQVCAANGECIPAGSCEQDADCPEGQECTFMGNCVPAGGCDTSQDCDAGTICGADKLCVPGGMCGAQAFTAMPVAPNMLLVLDRSCSMKDKIDGMKKWDIAVAAINQVTTSYAGLLRWGLIMFPDITKPNCGQTDYPVPLGDGNEQAIQDLLTAALVTDDAWFPDGPCVTNIDTAIEQASLDPALMEPDKQSYVMLITDGNQAGCSDAGGDNGTEMILADMFSNGIPTYVVGFGSAVGAGQLNMFADAGGAPLPGDPRYYQADNAAELEAAFIDIAGGLVSCSFKLDMPPPDWMDVFVFFNDILKVPFDPTDMEGWDYDEMTDTITFYGSFCEQLKSNEVWDIDIVFGCDEPVPQ